MSSSANAWGNNGLEVFALPIATPIPANPSLPGQALVWDVDSQKLVYGVVGGGGGGGGTVQAGVAVSLSSGYQTVVFPVAFSDFPAVLAQCRYDVNPLTFMQIANISPTGFAFRAWYRQSGSDVNALVPSGYSVHWMASLAA